jgi:UDP-3-O-acyl N-acetylglucosamine deacetylase
MVVTATDPILRQQRTIARRAGVNGFGYWSGEDVRVEFCPAEPDTGIVFVRTDLAPPRRIRSHVENRVDVPRRTNLHENGGGVEMVEHVLAALGGLQVDNCEVRVDAPEMPGCDGSSRAYVTEILAAGIVSQGVPCQQLTIGDVVRVGDDKAWVEARPATTGRLHVRCRIDYGPGSAIGEQFVELDVTPQSFQRELADCRTFILQEEAEMLRSEGLGRRTTYRDLLVFDERGPIQNVLRYDNECARHKALDLLGDLALAGSALVGTFIANCSGHRLNAELVQNLLEQYAVPRCCRMTA